ncbi:hypothetical protein A6048_05245 [Dietzia psychralcaliphila]|uniref:Uncharacterized protein n=2 Tax=Dietzia psychralcaliphila TaxID=139021 RepID=A0AAD0JSW1_9ACTN|nr:hypothetical protein A6048_05245 [Dietzia psychralcaliphila]
MARILDIFSTRWNDLGDGTQAEVLAKIAKEADRHRRYKEAAWAMPEADIDAIDQFLAERGYDLQTKKEGELFSWTAEIDDTRQIGGNDEQPEKTLNDRRAEVVRAILASGGFEAVAAFAANVEVPGYVGKTLAEIDISEDLDLVDGVLDRLGASTASEHPASDLAVAWGYAVARAEDFTWLKEVVAKRPDQAAVLLNTVRTSSAILGVVAKLEAEQQALFWKGVNPYRVDGEVVERVCEGLLDAGRPFGAMTTAAGHGSPGPSSDLIIRVLSTDFDQANEPDNEDTHNLGYTVGLLLNRLENSEVDDEVISNLEFRYLPVLNDYREPRALHRELARKPELFATAASSVYKPDDQPKTDVDAAVAGDETSEMSGEQFRFSSAAWSLLNGWHGPLPGSNVPDELPAAEAVQAWVEQVRVELGSRDRTQIASAAIGAALAAPVTDEDGTWPCEPVRNVIEHEQSDELESEFRISRLNQRGVHGRTAYAGGDQERAIAEEFRDNAVKVRNRWPRTGALLESLASSYDQDAQREDDDAERDARRQR